MFSFLPPVTPVTVFVTGVSIPLPVIVITALEILSTSSAREPLVEIVIEPYFTDSSAVLEARRYEHNLDNLVIFAGACQSFYEAIMAAGANFASAPKRVLIDMMDPLIVAESIAYTPVDEFVSISNIISNTREGISGVGGIQTRGAFRTGMPGL